MTQYKYKVKEGRTLWIGDTAHEAGATVTMGEPLIDNPKVTLIEEVAPRAAQALTPLEDDDVGSDRDVY